MKPEVLGPVRSPAVAIAIRPALWGELLELLLEQEPRITVVGRCQTEEQLAELLQKSTPNIALFDFEALGPNSEGVIARLRRAFPLVKILVLASRSSEETAVAVLRAGAAGLIDKQADFRTLIAAIRAVAAGETWANRRVTARALDQLAAPYRDHDSSSVYLTARELEVVDGVAQGQRNREIAATLGISEKTVKAHLVTIFAKLGVHSRTALALWATDRLHQKT